MRNEDKAKEIALQLFDDGHFYHNGISQRKEIEKAILQMAEWKEEQALKAFCKFQCPDDPLYCNKTILESPCYSYKLFEKALKGELK